MYLFIFIVIAVCFSIGRFCEIRDRQKANAYWANKYDEEKKNK
ncbi:hypothetical protein [Clostridium botulinum]|nr:hypothetical protein [Clostridium botulinum]